MHKSIFLKGILILVLLSAVTTEASAQAVPVNLGSDTSVCANESLVLDATYPNCTYMWSNGATTPTVTVSPATYSVTVTDTTGTLAPGSDTIVINSLNIPPVSISPSGVASICTGGSVTLTGSMGGTSVWYKDGVALPGPHSNTYLATTSGNYNMTKTNQNGCTDSAAVGTIVQVLDPPVAAWASNLDTVDLGISGEVMFTDNSTNATSWSWDFGDGNSSSDQNPVHTYSSAGNYTVVQKAQNEACPDDSISKVIVVIGMVSSDPFNQDVIAINVFPNPTPHYLQVQVEGQGKYFFEMYSLLGEKVIATKLSSGIQSLDMTELPRGIYSYRISKEDVPVKRGKLVLK